MIELRNFYCFATIASERSFTRAAEKLGVAQSNLSTMMARMEERVGGPLFVRGRQPLNLTALGARLFPTALAMAEAADILEQEVTQVRRDTGTGVVIGGHPALENIPIRQTLIDRFVKHYPAISLRIIELSPERMAVSLKAGEVDFLFSLSTLAFEDNSILLGSFAVKLAVPKELPVSQLDDIPLEALAGVPVLDWTGVDGDMHASVIGPLIKAGSVMITTPELSVSANLHYASERRAIFPLFDVFEGSAKLGTNFVIRPLAQGAIRGYLRLIAARHPVGPAQRAMWNVAQTVASEADV